MLAAVVWEWREARRRGNLLTIEFPAAALAAVRAIIESELKNGLSTTLRNPRIQGVSAFAMRPIKNIGLNNQQVHSGVGVRKRRG
jgi:hypothetical protein